MVRMGLLFIFLEGEGRGVKPYHSGVKVNGRRSRADYREEMLMQKEAKKIGRCLLVGFI